MSLHQNVNKIYHYTVLFFVFFKQDCLDEEAVHSFIVWCKFQVSLETSIFSELVYTIQVNVLNLSDVLCIDGERVSGRHYRASVCERTLGLYFLSSSI